MSKVKRSPMNPTFDSFCSHIIAFIDTQSNALRIICNCMIILLEKKSHVHSLDPSSRPKGPGMHEEVDAI